MSINFTFSYLKEMRRFVNLIKNMGLEKCLIYLNTARENNYHKFHTELYKYIGLVWNYCMHCNKKYTSQEEKLAHSCKNLQYRCQVCDKRYSLEYNLNTHLKIHGVIN